MGRGAVMRGASASARRRVVQPALLAVLVLPPPASGADVLAGRDGARAGLAADRREAAGMQRVDGDVVGGDVGVEPLERPVGQRVDLDQPVAGVPGGERHIAPAADCPRRSPVIQPPAPARARLQRAHLADLAAGLAGLDGMAKAQARRRGRQALQLGCVGRNTRMREAVALLAVGERFQRLGEKAAGVEREHIDRTPASAMACRMP